MRRSVGTGVFAVAILLLAALPGRGATTEQTKTLKLYPGAPDFLCVYPFGADCPWPGADGDPVHVVTECALSFRDPLPAGSVVTEVDARVSLLSSPVYVGLTGFVSLNAVGFGPVFDPDAVLGAFVPPAQETGCPVPINGFPGGLTTFLGVTVHGSHSATGVSKYNYRLKADGSPNIDQWGVPRQNSISVETGTSEFTMEFIEVTLHYLPPPKITFEITPATSDDDRKLLIRKARREDTYFSQYQQRIPGQDSDRDGKLDILATITDADGAPLPGKTVYLRVSDPADPSPYAASVAKRGDNAGTATLSAKEVVADASGQIHTTLSLPTPAAGDNYQVEASPVPGFGSTTDCTNFDNDCFRSGTITAWKRVYLELDRMFRIGTNLAADAPIGSTRIRTENAAGISVGDRIIVVHAPDHLAPGSAAGRFYSETHVIQKIHGRRHPEILLDSPLINAYFVESSPVDAIGDHLADAVGVIHGVIEPAPSDLYDAPLDFVQPLFKSAFVDYVVLDCQAIQVCDPIPYVPHYDSVPLGAVYAGLAQKWSFTRVDAKELPNHQHLLAGAATAIINQQNQLGSTSIDGYQPDDAPFSWVWDVTVNSQAGALGIAYGTFLNATIAHELAHQWDVNPPIFSTGGHCQLQSWDSGGECLMNGIVTADRGNGHVAFHDYADAKSEYKRIRQQPDPLPQRSSP